MNIKLARQLGFFRILFHFFIVVTDDGNRKRRLRSNRKWLQEVANSCYLSLALEAVHPLVSAQVGYSVGMSVSGSPQLVLPPSQDSPDLPQPGDVLELRGEDTVGGDDGLQGEELSLV